nr:UvrD-like helicase, ATP-binding domain, P-loop containing nucleoside triphosphate hydrolase [Tanacetum cinerariifolium]
SQPGKIFHFWGKDVYTCVPKHYTGKDVTAENFLAILAGDEKTVGAKKVVKSTPKGHHFTRHYPENGKFYVVGDRSETLDSQELPPNRLLRITFSSTMLDMVAAITRTRQRLWICENKEELSKPMCDYWKMKGFVQIRKLDDSVAQAMRVASSPQEWRERYLREAVGMYESVGKLKSAALSYSDLGEYGRAGKLYLYKCGKMDAAAECFSLAGCYGDAAEAYAKGDKFSNCLSVCKSEASIFVFVCGTCCGEATMSLKACSSSNSFGLAVGSLVST